AALRGERPFDERQEGLPDPQPRPNRGAGWMVKIGPHCAVPRNSSSRVESARMAASIPKAGEDACRWEACIARVDGRRASWREVDECGGMTAPFAGAPQQRLPERKFPVPP